MPDGLGTNTLQQPEDRPIHPQRTRGGKVSPDGQGVAGVLGEDTAGDDDHQGRVPGRTPGLDDGFGQVRQAMLTAECRAEGQTQDVEPSGTHEVL